MTLSDKTDQSDDSNNRVDNLGAVILCGGKSIRLGIDKSQLKFREQTFIQRIVNQVSQVTKKIVLAGKIGPTIRQQLQQNVVVAEDRLIDCGPLEGICVGLEQLKSSAEFAFVTSCDVPMLNPNLIRHLYHQIGDHHAVVPVDGKRVFGLAAIYRTDLHQEIDQRIRQGKLRVSDLAEELWALKLDVDSLRGIDPNLDSLTNINTADDYINLLERFGLKCPLELEFVLKKKRTR